MEQNVVKLEKADADYRLLNLGGTVLVAGLSGEDFDLMPASWVCPLDYDKVSAVVDAGHYTRKLLEKSNRVCFMIPGQGVAKETLYLGTHSKNDDAEKVAKSGAEFFRVEGCEFPLMKGCIAWIVCDLIRNEYNEKTHDLFFARILDAWVDGSVNEKGMWKLEDGNPALRTLHYVSGGKFYVLGDALDVAKENPA